MTTKEQDRVIWRTDLQKMMGVASETMRRYMVAGKLPSPDVSMSQKRVGWRVSTLREHGINVPA